MMEFEYELVDIESCELVGIFDDEYVYDIEVEEDENDVEDTHTFFGNDILVHNSLYISFAPIMESLNLDLNEVDGLQFILHFYRVFINKKFNTFLDEYAAKYHVKNIHDFEMETVSKTALFIGKKNYLNNNVYKDGMFYDDLTKFYPKGIEIVKSSTPSFVRGENQKGGVWSFIRYIYQNPDNLKMREILKVIKNIKMEFKLAELDDISLTTSLSNYSDKMIDDTREVKFVKGCHFAVRCAAYHNFLLNKHDKYKSKYDLLKSGKIKYFFISDNPMTDRFAYGRGFDPVEIRDIEGIEVDYDKQFAKTTLTIINRFMIPLGLPTVNKRLTVLNNLFGDINNQEEVDLDATVEEVDDLMEWEK